MSKFDLKHTGDSHWNHTGWVFVELLTSMQHVSCINKPFFLVLFHISGLWNVLPHTHPALISVYFIQPYIALVWFMFYSRGQGLVKLLVNLPNHFPPMCQQPVIPSRRIPRRAWGSTLRRPWSSVSPGEFNSIILHHITSQRGTHRISEKIE